jgi:phage-related protein
MASIIAIVLSYKMYKTNKYNLNKKYDDIYMGNIVSKLCVKISDYKKNKEKKKIMRIYKEVFEDDEEMIGLIKYNKEKTQI